MSEEIPEDKNAEAEEYSEQVEDAGDDLRVTKGRRIALIAVALVVVVLGASGGAYFFGVFDSLLGIKSSSKIASIDLGVPIRHELPMIKADLKTGACRSPLLRVVMVVEIGSKDLPRLEAMQLRINDAVATYLRDFERQDMVGKKGSDRFRAAAANIINNKIAPARIESLLFKEFIIQ
ncbi:MAG: flagellar basal body-associated FliL family protein [Proteobacteria bacterium]|nr:flagellar basal body-associated FliL family protein [Pseudomonadota bacterium]